MIRAYLFALDPTAAQEQALRSHCGAQRYAYNFGIELAGKIRAQRAAEYSYGLRGAELTPCSAYDLRRAWNTAKHERAPWWADNSKEAYSSGLANAATAFKNFGDSFAGARRGPKIRYPRFKGRRARLSCRFTTGAFGLTGDRRHVKLPRIGAVRTQESTRKLARHVESGTTRVLAATLSFQRGRWHVALSVELPDPQPTERTGGRVVGVDLGIKSLAVLSTGEDVPNPRHLDGALTALRRAQRTCARRRGPDKRTRTEPSTRWRKAKARVSALHTHAANQRRAGLHKLTTRLVREHDAIVVEDLNVAGMVRNRKLARHISGLGMGEFRRQLDYKATATGVRVHVADRWYPSSKTCSACGAVRAKLTLAEREFICESCGTRLDRDFNAALNLAALAAEVTSAESSRRDVKQPAGNPRKTAMGGDGYRHGKAPALREPTPRREAMAR
ncbi:MAG: IS607 family element RNA-guided endonuclease TnpB [Pseudonocardia sp.]|nr:IS607 family element RNA-guided endonuclease TnpB [Pseudonocardia sp.]